MKMGTTASYLFLSSPGIFRRRLIAARWGWKALNQQYWIKGHLSNNGKVDGFIHLAKEQSLPVLKFKSCR